MSGSLGDRDRWRPWRLIARASLAACVLTLPALPAAADPAGPAVPAANAAGAVRDAQWPLQTADVQRAWKLSMGQGVTVAVIDSGVEATHPDLLGRVTGGGDFAGGASGDGTHDGLGQPGHGTEVASLIAGTGMNYKSHGLLGLAPQAKILSFGVYHDGKPDPRAVGEAIRKAARDGAQVIVAPAAALPAGPAVRSAVRYALAQDTVVVSGVGEKTGTGATPAPRPSTVPGVLSVTAVDRRGQVWQNADRGTHVALAAPGTQILAAAPDGSYWTGAGTSFAAAWVAGAAALVRSAEPQWTAAQTIQKLIDTARTRGTQCNGDCGYGVVDPLRALTDVSVPRVKHNPLIASPPATIQSPSTAWDAMLIFAVAALTALALYIAVTAVFIRRNHPKDV